MIEENIAAVKQELFPEIRPKAWELHAHEIWNNRGFFANEKLKLNIEKKQEIFSKVLDLICDSEITLLDVIMFKDRIKEQYHVPKLMEYSWTFIVERFEHFLKQLPENTDNGLLFIDSSQKIPESEIRDVIQSVVMHGSYWQRIDRIIEHPIFIKSCQRNLIQLADMVAYTQRHYKKDSRFRDWFDMLKPKMYQPNGRLDKFGLKEFPR